MAWALATVGQSEPHDVFAILVRAAEWRIHDGFSNQGLANTAWAFVTAHQLWLWVLAIEIQGGQDIFYEGITMSDTKLMVVGASYFG